MENTIFQITNLCLDAPAAFLPSRCDSSIGPPQLDGAVGTCWYPKLWSPREKKNSLVVDLPPLKKYESQIGSSSQLLGKIVNSCQFMFQSPPTTYDFPIAADVFPSKWPGPRDPPLSPPHVRPVQHWPKSPPPRRKWLSCGLEPEPPDRLSMVERLQRWGNSLESWKSKFTFQVIQVKNFGSIWINYGTSGT